MDDIRTALRRIVTGDGDEGRSVIILDGGPSAIAGDADTGGLFEIWEDVASGALDPRDHGDLGNARAVLGPRAGNVQIRWFVVQPTPPGVPKPILDEATRAAFRTVDGEHHLADQARHSAMHKTHSLDVICLLSGEVSLILDGAETRVRPGQVVIQRGTAHAWEAHGGPALLLAVLIDRELRGGA